MDREHWKTGLASAAAFSAGLLVLAAALALGIESLLLGRVNALYFLLLPLPPLFSWLAVRKLNRLGLVRCWFPGNVAAGTAIAFLLAAPLSVAAASAAVLQRGIYWDMSFWALICGLSGFGMLLGGTLAAIPEKTCVLRILFYGLASAAFVVLAWTALAL
ncbi:MAG TPA: hypothetical protein DCM05_16955 [Elusimicrobia bacterium]|nr:hypothetical protein [Elusimicrobiota bacterium]